MRKLLFILINLAIGSVFAMDQEEDIFGLFEVEPEIAATTETSTPSPAPERPVSLSDILLEEKRHTPRAVVFRQFAPYVIERGTLLPTNNQIERALQYKNISPFEMDEYRKYVWRGFKNWAEELKVKKLVEEVIYLGRRLPDEPIRIIYDRENPESPTDQPIFRPVTPRIPKTSAILPGQFEHQ